MVPWAQLNDGWLERVCRHPEGRQRVEKELEARGGLPHGAGSGRGSLAARFSRQLWPEKSGPVEQGGKAAHEDASIPIVEDLLFGLLPSSILSGCCPARSLCCSSSSTNAQRVRDELLGNGTSSALMVFAAAPHAKHSADLKPRPLVWVDRYTFTAFRALCNGATTSFPFRPPRLAGLTTPLASSRPLRSASRRPSHAAPRTAPPSRCPHAALMPLLSSAPPAAPG